MNSAAKTFSLHSLLLHHTLLSRRETIFSPIPQEKWLADNGRRKALSGRPMLWCQSESPGTRGSRGEYLSFSSALSPQVGLISDRKCNASLDLRQNKSAEFKISSFLTLLAIRPHHEKMEWNMSGLVVSTVFCSRPAAQWRSFPLFTFLSFGFWLALDHA